MNEHAPLSEDINDYCFIDTETRSRVNVKTHGAYLHNSVENQGQVLICTYAIGDGPTQVWAVPTFKPEDRLHWIDAPKDLLHFLTKAERGKGWFVAWNAAFDRLSLNRGVDAAEEGDAIRVDMIIDAMAQAVKSHLPPDLAGAAQYAGAKVQKDTDGKRLIRMFCDGEKDHTPQSDPEDWAKFLSYASDDIDAMRHVFEGTLPLPLREWREYWANERINDRGMPIDGEFVRCAAELAEYNAAKANDDVVAISGGALYSVNQNVAILDWLLERLPGAEAEAILTKALIDGPPDEDGNDTQVAKLSLERERVEQLLAYLERIDDEVGMTDPEFEAYQMLEVRVFGASATPQKFIKMARQLEKGRLKGQYVFNGAAATGRFSSRGVQLHNLTRSVVVMLSSDPDFGQLSKVQIEMLAIEMVMRIVDEGVEQVYNDLKARFGPVGRTLSRLIRPAIFAEPGKTLVWGDWSAIEARVLPWLSGRPSAQPVLDAFYENDADPSLPDIYERQAGLILGKPAEDVTKGERQSHGKVPILSLGFGGGNGALHAMAANYGVSFADDMATSVVKNWRDANSWARAFWDELWEAALSAMQNPGQPFKAGRVTCMYEAGYLKGTLFCELPDGRLLLYPSIKWEQREIRNKFTGDLEVKNQLTYRRGRGRSAIWYGTLCLGADTEVATSRGWVKIVDVRDDDKLWDGVEWVPHGGLAFQGVKRTIPVDGVAMTPDHEVLTQRGWRRADESIGLDRAAVRKPDSYEEAAWCSDEGPYEVAERGVVAALRLRERGASRGRGDTTRATQEEAIRLPRMCGGGGSTTAAHSRGQHHAAVRGVAVHARALHAAVASGVAQLRRTGYHGLRQLARIVRELPLGHGSLVPAGADIRAEGQRRPVHTGELLLGAPCRSGAEQAQHSACGPAQGQRADGRTYEHPALSVDAEPVYDLTNAGPRSRFVVRGLEGPLIVHNCENITQAVAGSLMRALLVRLDDLGWPVIAHTHDEAVLEVLVEQAEEAKADLEAEMTRVLDWADGLPLACGITVHDYYSKTVD